MLADKVDENINIGNLPIEPSDWLAAIINNSEYAIISKTLDGIITTWNPGAQKLYGYSPEEAIGRHINIVIPSDRYKEEENILKRLTAGELIQEFETIRKRKDDQILPISLSATPIKDVSGRVIGATKISRDITLQKEAQERQNLLMQEMRHRLKNVFTVSASLLQISAKNVHSVPELVSNLMGRLIALSKVSDLTLPPEGDYHDTSTTIHTLLRSIIQPLSPTNRLDKLDLHGKDVDISGTTLTSLALILHELATNAAKYGAMSVVEGQLIVTTRLTQDSLILSWKEEGAKQPLHKVHASGFGTTLEEANIRMLNGKMEKKFTEDGVHILITIPTKVLMS